MSSGVTPSQTVGPFFAIGMPWEEGPLVVPRGSTDAIRISGTVYDGHGDPVADSLIETWQADPDGRFADLHGHGGPSSLAGFRGFGRFGLEDGDGRFEILTVKPGPVPWPGGGQQAPHIAVSVFARGMLHRCVTRIYFSDEPGANAGGRYAHKRDQHPAPLDANFTGVGRCLTDAEGRYAFTTIKPGPYPWGNHHNAWRPAHIHFSLLGRAFTQRLVTQMYFPGDPFFEYDPIFNSVRDPAARERMISRFSIHDTVESWAVAYQWDIYLRGPGSTPFEEAH